MRRYVLRDGIRAQIIKDYDVIIIGNGIAGLYAALNLSPKLKCAVLGKEGIDISNSWLAQGGIAAAVSKEDRPQLHFEDTIIAGAGLCDEKAVRVLVDEGPGDIEKLVGLNVPFDLNDEGTLHITREGGHTRNRVVHARGDATGRETVKTLAAIAASRDNITLLQNVFFIDILTNGTAAAGAVIYDGEYKILSSRHIVVCTGGIGQVYTRTTNPSIATGDGVAAAIRAGAYVNNMEFIQFHPTGLYSETKDRTFLISEALRGEGAKLVNDEGRRFMEGEHEMAELAPRDIVARGIVHEMAKRGLKYVYLDIRDQSAQHLSTRFPTIYSVCLKKGIDISKELIPVSPVQHYIMGGISADLYGMSNIAGLYACGEAAFTGVHGANRLASNSMLECLVFSRRAAIRINESYARSFKNIPEYSSPERRGDSFSPETEREKIRDIMNRYGWVIRNRKGLETGLYALSNILEGLEESPLPAKEHIETLNMAVTAREILKAALMRPKSVGAHYMED